MHPVCLFFLGIFGIVTNNISVRSCRVVCVFLGKHGDLQNYTILLTQLKTLTSKSDKTAPNFLIY